MNSKIVLKNSIFCDDCLKIIPLIPNNSIPLILTDLPYEKTKNKWDTKIPLQPLFDEYERILTEKGILLLFGQDDFSAELIIMGKKKGMYRYNLVWNKVLPSGHLNANVRPLRSHEDIIVFYKDFGIYNPQKTLGKKSHSVGRSITPKSNKNYGVFDYQETRGNLKFPKSILSYKNIHTSLRLHPTQKPINLLQYLIKTYSSENDIVLDNCAGVLSTAVACIYSNRRYICIEINKEYIAKGLNRIKKAKKEIIDFRKIKFITEFL